jgi:hypothetical protein
MDYEKVKREEVPLSVILRFSLDEWSLNDDQWDGMGTLVLAVCQLSDDVWYTVKKPSNF